MIALLLALVVGTWNGDCFPSGRLSYRGTPKEESAKIAKAGRFLAEGLRAVDPAGTNDIVLILNEMRDPEAVGGLLDAVGRKGLRIAAMTQYRLGDRADEQQDAIATTLPVVKSRWARWRYNPDANPPRGYAFAAVVAEPSVTAHVYAVHLKANGGGKDAAVATTNRLKRASAIGQFLKIERGMVPVILAGDFNADRWNPKYAEDTIFPSLESAGYSNPLARLPDGRRRTHVAGLALDYVLAKGFPAAEIPVVLPAVGLSDHSAVFVRIDRASDAATPKRRGPGECAE